MSGDNFDQALFDIWRTVQPGHDQAGATAARVNDLYLTHGQETGVWIVNGTKHAYERYVEISKHRLALVAALDAVEQATMDATEALDSLYRAGDAEMLTPRRGDRGARYILSEQALYQIRLGAAAALHHAPDPEDAEGA